MKHAHSQSPQNRQIDDTKCGNIVLPLTNVHTFGTHDKRLNGQITYINNFVMKTIGVHAITDFKKRF